MLVTSGHHAMLTIAAIACAAAIGFPAFATDAPPSLSTIPDQVNLALRKPATQSSVFAPQFGAEQCVDGSRSGHSSAGLCHTRSEVDPWWQVDLQDHYALSEIVVYNRTDCCGERERTLSALLSADGQNWQRIYTHSGADFPVLHIPVNGRNARYIRLQLKTTDYLNLVEVEAYGSRSAPAGSASTANESPKAPATAEPGSGASPQASANSSSGAIRGLKKHCAECGWFSGGRDRTSDTQKNPGVPVPPTATAPIPAQPQTTQEPAPPPAPPPAAASAPYGVTAQCKELFNRGLERTKAGNQQDAIRLYGEVLAQCPRTCPAMNNLGSAYNAIGDRNNAKVWFEAAVRCDPENQTFKTNATAVSPPGSSSTKPGVEKQCQDIVSQGIAKSKSHDLQGAIQLYQKALQLCPQHCPAMNDIGVTYEALGDKNAAKTWVDAAIRCNPGSDLYKQNTARISASQQQLPAAPPPVASGARFDGVYVGSTMHDDGTQGPKVTWTISGSRISLVSDADQQRRSWAGEIKPSGEFNIRVVDITHTGKVVGNALSGSYAGELRMFNGSWTSRVKGTFKAVRRN